MKNSKLLGALALFGGTLVVSWMTHGTGVVQNDPERNISIPEQLTVPLHVQAAYSDSTIFIRYRWPAEHPGILHDVLRYEDGEWIREGCGGPGSPSSALQRPRWLPSGTGEAGGSMTWRSGCREGAEPL
ncbi:MAG TPA: hypothetical protein VK991_03180 [Halomonas sp.]|nr:hypothetical protein [Halomonas sp.]